MVEPAGPEARTGAHSLGPHVVGQRVVVRRLLPGATGPSGGPAMTDVLGVCEAWGEGEARVRRADGTVVTIPTALIVSGKPVPPRPSPRLRVSPAEAEAHAATMWPHVRRQPLGEWVLRTDPAPVGRPLKRANSCLAIGDPGVAAPVAAVRAFYEGLERPALAQVVADSTEESLFADAGWEVFPGGEADFMLSGLATALRVARVAGPAAEIAHRVDEDGPRVRVALLLDHEEVAVGHAALDDSAGGRGGGGWLGLHSLTTVPTRRRGGLARAVVAALLEWGAEQGATTAWLHVETGNGPARALYEGLGFSVHHTNRYLAAPT